MKTGLKVAAAMMAIMSGTVIAAPFSVSSADMRDGQTLAQTHWFGGFGCTGGNISPQIAWKNAPAGTRGDRLRSGCADRERLVALDGGEYCPTGDWLSRWRRRQK